VSLGPFLRLEKYCWNYSVLSITRANGGDARIIRTLFYTSTVSLARHRLRNVLLTLHRYAYNGIFFLKNCSFEVLYFILY
jgi:hypothetical protein